MSLPFEGTASQDTIRALTLPMILNYLGIRLNGPKAAGHETTLNLVSATPARKPSSVWSTERSATPTNAARQMPTAK